jgi:PKD repeat protein
VQVFPTRAVWAVRSVRMRVLLLGRLSHFDGTDCACSYLGSERFGMAISRSIQKLYSAFQFVISHASPNRLARVHSRDRYVLVMKEHSPIALQTFGDDWHGSLVVMAAVAYRGCDVRSSDLPLMAGWPSFSHLGASVSHISFSRHCHVTVLIIASLMLSVLGLVVPRPSAEAVTGDLGYVGPSTAGSGGAATGEKPESKLWWNDGRWWASMFESTSKSWHIFYLNRAASPKTWVDTGTVIDSRANSRADALWDGSNLYVASHVFASSNTSATSGQPARLYRFSYDGATKRYTLDSGFPATIGDYSSETLTLDKDSTGRLWATWTRGQNVYVNATSGSDSSWGTPFSLPVSDATNLDPDDIAAVIAFRGKIGVMWSNHTVSKVYFAYHIDGDSADIWSGPEQVTLPGPGQSDDHLNVKALEADSAGRVFAAIKTSLDEVSGQPTSAPQIVVLSRGSTGGWDRATFGTLSDCHTRPILMVDSSNSLLHVYATAPDSGCAFAGAAGSIFEKTSPLNNLSFSAGRGTPVMRDVASPNLNNVTGSKQTVNANRGIVLLASNDTAKHYWFSDESLASEVPQPVAAFSATPTSGTVPLTVQFTDTSSDSPTAWSWDFGDGSSATTQNPSHTFSSAGTFSVSLTVTNSSGSDTITKSDLVTVASSQSGGKVTGGKSTNAYSSKASTAVTLQSPSDLLIGDVLIAQITADNKPSMASVPAGWNAVPGVQPTSIGTGARIFAYYHVVTNPSNESASWNWQLSAEQKWGGGITAFHGADTANPFGGITAVTAVDATYAATSLKLSGITTNMDGSMIVTGLGCDCSTLKPTLPSEWSQPWGSQGGQYAGLGYRQQDQAGATGSATWSLGAARGVAGWLSALKPAG